MAWMRIAVAVLLGVAAVACGDDDYGGVDGNTTKDLSAVVDLAGPDLVVPEDLTMGPVDGGGD